MKINVSLDVTVKDVCSPLGEDVMAALLKKFSGMELVWHDPSLQRWLTAEVAVDSISRQ